MIDKSRAKIEEMFDSIAPNYDILNHILSLGIYKQWRKRVVRILKKEFVTDLLDVAAGTGDLSIAVAKKIKACKVIGVDISQGMLAVGEKKVAAARLESQVTLKRCDALNLEFEDESFDAVTVAFGVRNFENLEKGISEMFRVLRKDGILVVLELSIPTNPILKALYMFYFFKVLPLIGRMKSKNISAYSYLPSSVAEFPSGSRFCDILTKCGFKSATFKALTFGICTIYVGKKG